MIELFLKKKAVSKFVTCCTMLLFLTSCATYQGTYYSGNGAGNAEVKGNHYQHDLTLCIIPASADHTLVVDSGCNNVEIECDIAGCIQSKIKDDFRSSTVLGAKDSRKCDINLYLKQTMTSENSVMSYQLEMKAEDVKAGKVFYAERTGSSQEYDKSKPAFMVFGTLLFPPVLGGFFYAIRTHAIAGTNYDIASGMINSAVEENVAKFSKASFPPQ